MSMEYRRSYRGGLDPGQGILWPLVVMIGGLIALVLALPALAIGVVLQRLTSARSWSFPLWFVLTFIGAGLVYYLHTHGLERMITAQLMDYALAIKQHHADVTQWNLSRLWSETWPVWVRTLAVAPVVAFWRELEASGNGDSAEILHQQERERQRLVARSKSRATRRTRRPGRIPDAVNGQMVVGVPIDEEHAQ
jgi:hypothetical protein